MSNVITYQEQDIDFSKPFERITVADSILQYNPQISAADLEDIDALRAHAKRAKSVGKRFVRTR